MIAPQPHVRVQADVRFATTEAAHRAHWAADAIRARLGLRAQSPETRPCWRDRRDKNKLASTWHPTTRNRSRLLLTTVGRCSRTACPGSGAHNAQRSNTTEPHITGDLCVRAPRAHMCRYVRARPWSARRSGATFCTATASAERQIRRYAAAGRLRGCRDTERRLWAETHDLE